MNTLRIAILDLYEGEQNEGMRCILQLVEQFKTESSFPVQHEVFDVRLKNEIAPPDFDIYISSGGPGSPLASEGSEWEANYFGLMDALREHNRQHPHQKRFVFLICHSFQVYCRHYKYAQVSKRRSEAFGIFPIHKTKEARHEPLFKNLDDPFYAVDTRFYQVTQPSARMMATGAQVLCIEKERPHVDLERAVMGMRFDDATVGFQFHPEADYDGMFKYLLREDKKSGIIERHGEKKYVEMLKYLNDPDKIKKTYKTIIPTFFRQAAATRLTVL